MVTQKLKRWKLRKMAFLFGFFLLCVPVLSFAEEYPTKPINIILGSAPGQIGDVTTRMILGKAEKFLGQPFVITNNNAGAGTVLANTIAKSKPDGYTIGSIPSSVLVWIPHVRTVTYKMEDFVPIMHNILMESGVVVQTDSPWKTFKELVEDAKQNPGKINYAITGSGNPMHLAMEYVAKVEGIQWTAVPTPGSDPNMFLLGGHVSAYSGSTSWVPHVRAGKFRLLAVHSEKRMKEFPEVPTFLELGYDFVHETVGMFIAPKGTPLPIIEKLDNAFRKALDDKDYLDLMEKLRAKPEYRNHQDLQKYLEEANDQVGRVIKKLGITIEPQKK
jgi:tripartite-type tricarboxylate transporter receptor subunit TctC